MERARRTDATARDGRTISQLDGFAQGSSCDASADSVPKDESGKFDKCEEANSRRDTLTSSCGFYVTSRAIGWGSGVMVRISKRVGVVLFQLGGPDSLAAVEPFLFNLFCDPDIIDFPFSRIGRRPLAKLISSTRAKKAAQHYATIGGGSPIRKFTEQQAAALEAQLVREGVDARCVVAMRYWHPFTAEAIARTGRGGVDQVVLLPLYPQYSKTTTGSSLNEWRRRWTGCADLMRGDLLSQPALHRGAGGEDQRGAGAIFRMRKRSSSFSARTASGFRDREGRPVPAAD